MLLKSSIILLKNLPEATGCSEFNSAANIHANTSGRVEGSPVSRDTRATVVLPCVIVPVLSNTTVFTYNNI